MIQTMDTILRTFKNLFKTKKQKQMEQEKKVPIAITCYSQPHVLQQRMKEANLTHGDRVTADISPVRLESHPPSDGNGKPGKMVMYFCPMQGVTIHERLEKGDGFGLPADAIIEGLSVLDNFKPGLYELKNVQLFSNGTLQVLATENTEFVPV